MKGNWPRLLIFFGLALLITFVVGFVIGRSIRMPSDIPMVFVPGGEFEMGGDAKAALLECQKFRASDDCQREGFMDEEPLHTVRLDDFYIDQYEVTNARYAECVEAGECFPPRGSGSSTRASYYGDQQFSDFPVILVSWFDARRYCQWRGMRLPTEAEWEKAARGTDGRLYPWGDTFDGSQANFCDRSCEYEWAWVEYDDGYADTAPVGSYPEGVSPYGVYDMAGNVWEWVADWYEGNYYSISPGVNPSGPPSGEYRVVRGGAWFSRGDAIRAAHRLRNVPTATYHLVGGFRCARSP